MEAGETPRQALERKLVEELGIHVSKRPPILLLFHHVAEYDGKPVNKVFEQIRWEPLSSLPAYDFLDGDRDFIRHLARGDIRLP